MELDISDSSGNESSQVTSQSFKSSACEDSSQSSYSSSQVIFSVIKYLTFCFNSYQKDPMTSHIEASKAIVFIPCLLKLFNKCPQVSCSSVIDPDNIEVKEIGAVVVIKYMCNENHSGEWSSSPFIGEGNERVGVTSLMLASCTLTCGLSISQVPYTVSISYSISDMFIFIGH